MLIAQADIHGVLHRPGHESGLADIRIHGEKVIAIGQLAPLPGESVFNMQGGAVLPGLNDHHIHLMAYATALDSVPCGPPQVGVVAELIDRLKQAEPRPDGWIRGIGYHESLAGSIDRSWLDRVRSDVPIRVQHRSGRLWMLNSAGLARLTDSIRCANPQYGYAFDSGRFFDLDAVLGAEWGRSEPSIGAASRQLAAFGITGLTDLTPHNDDQSAAAFARSQASGELLQALRVGGRPGMTHALAGPIKVHLHESALPDFEHLRDLMRTSHDQERAVAVHCVTQTELVFTLAAFREAGVLAGDRIEHASICPPALLEQLHELGLTVVTQPHFVSERGDAYLCEVASDLRSWLYRCRGFLNANIPLAAGSDAPFGHADPWCAMRAAVERRTASQQPLGEHEALTPEQALALFLGSLENPGEARRIEVGAVADLCLLDRPWREARSDLRSRHVRATMRAGRWLYRSKRG